MNLQEVSDEDLKKEIRRRNIIIVNSICPTCHKWPVESMVYSSHIEELHCTGCLKPINRCTC